MPETFLNAIGSWPVRTGTFELASEIKRLKDHYDIRQPWRSVPTSIVGESLRGANASAINNQMMMGLGESLQGHTVVGDKTFRKAPFLWGNINVPISDPVGLSEGYIKNEVPNISRALDFELRDYPGNVKMPSSVKFRRKVPFFYGNAFNPASGEMRLADVSPRQIFHEFGHARDLGRPWRRNMVVGADVLGKSLKYTVPASILFRDAISDYIPGSVDDKVVDALQTYGPEAWLASKMVSDIQPEISATMHAGKKMRALAEAVPKKFGGEFLAKQLRANKLGMASRIPRVAIPYALMALARSAMKNDVKKKKSEGLEKESAMPMPAALEALWRGGKTLMQRGAPVTENLQHVFSPLGAPTAPGLRRMVSNPLFRDSLIGVGLPVGVSGLTLAALNDKKEKADAKKKAEQLGEYEELADTSSLPFLAVALRAGKKVGKDALSVLSAESLGELLS